MSENPPACAQDENSFFRSAGLLSAPCCDRSAPGADGPEARHAVYEGPLIADMGWWTLLVVVLVIVGRPTR